MDHLKTLYQGPRFAVKQGQVTTSKGKTIDRDFVSHPGAVVILPFLDATHIVMIRNQRYAVSKELWELPAGTLEPDELPIETAKRELIEETGYQARRIEPLLEFYTSPGFCNEKMYAFIAHDLTQVGQALEESENIVVEIIPWKKALTMASEGLIEDAKTLVCLYHAMMKKNI